MRDRMIEGKGLRKVFRSGILSSRAVVAVDGVDIRIDEGETVALVGESGSGKSTLGRLLLYLIKPDEGRVLFEGVDLAKLKGKELRRLRTKMQLIPQNPEDAFDPRWRLYSSLAEPLRIHGFGKEEERKRVPELAKAVGLKEEHLSRYPHELSGGELQRAVIARALALNPKFIVCDEPTSMLDLSTQASIVRLLMKLQRKMGLTILFITHDIELAEVVGDRILVMKNGRISNYMD